MSTSTTAPKLQGKAPIITVKEARKLLEASDSKLTDAEIKDMLKEYEAIARYAIQEYLVRK